jgi:glycosyltransferase involved in cell wall biosynthesis
MKILIVSWYFPPVNSIGAVRVGKFARYLVERGHDIGVVAGSNWRLPETTPVDFPLQRVAYAKARDINAPLTWASQLLAMLRGNRNESGAGAGSDAAGPAAAASGRSRLQRLTDTYMTLTNIPDLRVGWYPDAVRQGMRLCRDWRPDIIFSSAPHHTASLVACRLAARLGVPWVSEIRDRWADDNYADFPSWRHAMDEKLERFVLGRAKGIVAVTEPWREFYARKYGKPTEVAHNGYDPLDFPFDPAARAENDSRHVSIVYTGGIYPGRRDPTALFEALKRLGPEAEQFRVQFYGTSPGDVWPIADRVGVRNLVEVLPPVPYAQSIRVQWNADVLLLLQWNSPREEGVCPGKLFEYLASLRPILGIGYEQGVPAGFVRERNAGIFANDPDLIASHLRRWAAEKKQHGVVLRLPATVREGLARNLQYERIERFLGTLLR